MKRHSPLKDFLKTFQQLIVWRILKSIETPLIRYKGQPKYPPIFVTGPPRSGSTLLYQLICRGLKVCYLTNFMRCFATSPILASILIKLIGTGISKENYTSWYGLIRGWNSPSQGIDFWRRFFGKEFYCYMYMDADCLKETAMRDMVGTISFIESLFNLPFVNKWQGHAVHILPLVKSFPNAIFIRITREPIQMCQSLLKCRLDLFGDLQAWVSAKPKEYDQIKDKPHIDQICEQIYYLERNMDEDSKKVGEHRFLTLEYESLCSDPRGVLQSIQTFYQKNSGGFELALRDPIPESFPCSNNHKVSQEEYHALKTCIDRLSKSRETFESIDRSEKGSRRGDEIRLW